MASSPIVDYLNEVKECLDSIREGEVRSIAEAIFDAYIKGKNIFILGNGGSASTASHFVCDLSKGTAREGKPRLKAVSLTDNVALMTAISNDIDYASVFKEQLATFLSKGDVVICISASGNSPNVLEAAKYARSRGALVIGFIGFGGGKLKELVAKAIIFLTEDYGQVEDAHMVLVHLVSREVARRIENEA